MFPLHSGHRPPSGHGDAELRQHGHQRDHLVRLRLGADAAHPGRGARAGSGWSRRDEAAHWTRCRGQEGAGEGWKGGGWSFIWPLQAPSYLTQAV